MHQGIMKAWLESSHLSGANSTYVEEMYEAYQEDPQSSLTIGVRYLIISSGERCC